MSRARDPLRWSDVGSDAPQELAAALRSLRERSGSAAQIAALEQRLGGELAAPTVAGTAIAAAPWLKLTGAALLAGAIAIYGLTHSAEPEPKSARTPLPKPAATMPLAPREHARAASPPTATPGPQQAPSVLRTAVRRRAAAVAPTAPEPAAAPPESELALLQRSQAALDRDPNAALELAEEHARDYPHGAFSQEREILALEALLKLRRPAEALARAERFVRAYPESPHSQRVRGLLARSRSLLPVTNPPRTDHPLAETPMPGSGDEQN